MKNVTILLDKVPFVLFSSPQTSFPLATPLDL